MEAAINAMCMRLYSVDFMVHRAQTSPCPLNRGHVEYKLGVPMVSSPSGTVAKL